MADIPQMPPAAAAVPAAASAVPAAAGETLKWKHVVEGYRSSKYFKIRSIARDLRPFVAEVLQAPDIRSSNAAQEILIKAKFMIEVLKEMKAETGFTAELKKHKEPGLDVPMGKPERTEMHAPAQPQAGGKHMHAPAQPQAGGKHMHAPVQPQAGAPAQPQAGGKHMHAPAQPQAGGKHMHAPAQPQAGGKHVAPEKQDKPGKQDQQGKQDKPEKQYVSKKARKASSGKVPEAKTTVLKESEKLDGEQPLSYVVGGSPIGWNFLLFPSGDAVYYGVTKESARLRQAAK